MALTFQLGISSADAITIMPEYSSTFGEKQIRSEILTQSGRRFVYKFGDYDQIKLNVDYVSGINASVINSWWDNNTELLFFINSSDPNYEYDYSEVFSDYTFSEVTRGVTSLDYIKLVENVNSGYHHIIEAFDIEQNVDFYYDVKLKAAGKNRARIDIIGGSQWPIMDIYLDNGSYYITGSDYFFHTEISSENDDFWRATIGCRFSDVSTVRCQIRLINSDGVLGYVGDGTSGIWAGDATLKGTKTASEVHSIFIANKTKPLSKYAKPYTTYLKGSIKLEGY